MKVDIKTAEKIDAVRYMTMNYRTFICRDTFAQVDKFSTQLQYFWPRNTKVGNKN